MGGTCERPLNHSVALSEGPDGEGASKNKARSFQAPKPEKLLKRRCH